MLDATKNTIWNMTDALGGVSTVVVAWLWHSIDTYGHIIIFLGGMALGIARFTLLCYQIRNARERKNDASN